MRGGMCNTEAMVHPRLPSTREHPMQARSGVLGRELSVYERQSGDIPSAKGRRWISDKVKALNAVGRRVLRAI